MTAFRSACQKQTYPWCQVESSGSQAEVALTGFILGPSVSSPHFLSLPGLAPSITSIPISVHQYVKHPSVPSSWHFKKSKTYPTLSYITDFVFKMYSYCLQASAMETNMHTSTLQQAFLLQQFFKNFLEKDSRQTHHMPNSVKVRFQCVIMTISYNSLLS